MGSEAAQQHLVRLCLRLRLENKRGCILLVLQSGNMELVGGWSTEEQHHNKMGSVERNNPVFVFTGLFSQHAFRKLALVCRDKPKAPALPNPRRGRPAHLGQARAVGTSIDGVDHRKLPTVEEES